MEDKEEKKEYYSCTNSKEKQQQQNVTPTKQAHTKIHNNTLHTHNKPIHMTVT